MNTAGETATSSRAGAIALAFGVGFALLYVICDLAALPMFTYHPGTDRIDWGFTPPRPDEGPAMYWYGWIANSALGASIFGALAALLPEAARRRMPSALAWAIPLVLLPLLLYSLKFYWRWE